MKVKVLLFGIVREIAGSPELRLEYPQPICVDELLENVKEKYKKLRSLKSIVVAVNNEYAKPDQIINPDDEIAIIPPVAGG
jgi:molybdopterin synthase sulfur carrier subunit